MEDDGVKKQSLLYVVLRRGVNVLSLVAGFFAAWVVYYLIKDSLGSWYLCVAGPVSIFTWFFVAVVVDKLLGWPITIFFARI